MYCVTELLDELAQIEFRTHPRSNLVALGFAGVIGAGTIASLEAIHFYAAAPSDHIHEGQQRNTPPGQVRIAMAQGTSTGTAAMKFINTTPQQYIDTPQPFISGTAIRRE